MGCGVGWLPDATAVALVQPRGLSARGGSPGPRPQGERGGYFPNFCWNFNRRRGALRPDAPAEGSPRRMLLASVSYRTLAHKLRSQRHFTASVRPVRLGASVLDCFCGDWSPSKALRRAKPSPGAHSSAEAASGSTLPARPRGAVCWSGVASRCGAAASPLARNKKKRVPRHDKTGPWPRTSTIP